MRELYEELVALDERITHADHMVQRVFTQSAPCQKLAQIEGIGPVVAIVLVAAERATLRNQQTGGSLPADLINSWRASDSPPHAAQDRCPQSLDHES